MSRASRLGAVECAKACLRWSSRLARPLQVTVGSLRAWKETEHLGALARHECRGGESDLYDYILEKKGKTLSLYLTDVATGASKRILVKPATNALVGQPAHIPPPMAHGHRGCIGGRWQAWQALRTTPLLGLLLCAGAHAARRHRHRNHLHRLWAHSGWAHARAAPLHAGKPGRAGLPAIQGTLLYAP